MAGNYYRSKGSNNFLGDDIIASWHETADLDLLVCFCMQSTDQERQNGLRTNNRNKCHIFTTRLTIMGLHFQVVHFQDFGCKKTCFNICFDNIKFPWGYYQPIVPQQKHSIV